jgi:hypothetical protein
MIDWSICAKQSFKNLYHSNMIFALCVAGLNFKANTIQRLKIKARGWVPPCLFVSVLPTHREGCLKSNLDSALKISGKNFQNI